MSSVRIIFSAVIWFASPAYAGSMSSQDVLDNLYHPCVHCQRINCNAIKPDKYGTRSVGVVNFGQATQRLSKDGNCYACFEGKPGQSGIIIGTCLIVPGKMIER